MIEVLKDLIEVLTLIGIGFLAAYCYEAIKEIDQRKKERGEYSEEE